MWNWIKKLFGFGKKAEAKPVEKNPIDEAIEAQKPAPLPSGPIGEKRAIPDFKFVDSSHHHKQFDVKAYAKGCKLFINKATQGNSFVDSTHVARKKLCKENGITYLGYHFYECTKDWKSQWDHYSKVHGEFIGPAILDYELSGGNTMSQLRDKIEESYLWLCEAEKVTGKTPIVYIGYSLAKELKLPAKFKRFPLWVPRYANALGTIPSPWSEENMFAWQFTESGAFPGMGPSNDVNVYYGKANVLNL